MKIEHIGIVVRDLEVAESFYRVLFPEAEFYRESMAESGMEMSFILQGGYKIELIQPVRENSPVSKFLEKNGEGIHHLAFCVGDIEKMMKHAEDNGIRLLTKEPYIGAEGHLVCFMHPKDTHNVLYEFCQHAEIIAEK